MILKLKDTYTLFHWWIQRGALLFASALLSIVLVNSPYAHYHDLFCSKIIAIKIWGGNITVPVRTFVNEFLMAIFFLVISMEIKREIIDGYLKEKDQRLLPITAAFAGALLPILIYYVFNHNDTIAVQGWAIASATDIGFARGLFSLFGQNLPCALKVFLAALAVIDDFIAILIIAVFYSSTFNFYYLVLTLPCCGVLFLFNKLKVQLLIAYIVVGIVMWYFFLKSGLHSTIGGVLLGIFIPLKTINHRSLLKTLEKRLTIFVEYLVLPIFAFFNCGIALHGLTPKLFLHPVVLGIALGLFFGKIIGISSAVWALVKLKIVKLDNKIKLQHYYLVSLFCSVGFTMSLFISLVSFNRYQQYLDLARTGIIFALLLTIMVILLRKILSKKLKNI